MPEIRANGVCLNVVQMGAGTPVLVCVHGLLLDNHASFYMTVAPGLARRARVVLYDLRGHGLSEQPPSGYSVDDMVADLVGLADAVVPDTPVVVVGHSFGGYVALRFAASYPSRVAGLVLIEAHTGLAEFGRTMGEVLALSGEARDRKLRELFGQWIARHQARGHEGAPAEEGALDADGAATVRLAGRLPRRRKSALVAKAESLHGRTTFAADVAASPSLDDGLLEGIGCPVLALYGEHSDLRGEGERLARRLPRCRLKIVTGGEHGILFQSTAWVRDTTQGWLDEVFA